MFLDSAQMQSSVVSHAKELNYIPQSAKSSAANVSLTITTTTPLNGPLTILKGTSFSGQNSNGVYQFVTAQNQTFTSTNNTYYANNIIIYEGTYINDTFVVDYTQGNTVSFVLTNPNIDISSLTVTATESGVNTQFTQAYTLYNLLSNSNIFFLQGAQNGQYEIVFGDGNLGRKPNNLATITVNYRVTNGDSAQGRSEEHTSELQSH